MSKIKYELTKNTKEVDGHTLHQIKAVKDIRMYDVKKGDLGGWIESEANLSQEWDCWVSDNAMVYDGAAVSQFALVRDNAMVSDNAEVSSRAKISDSAEVSGNTKVIDSAEISGRAKISGDVIIFGKARVSGNAELTGIGMYW